MNTAFLFDVEAYKGEGETREDRAGQMVATGSQETRARRRLLDAIHTEGWVARSLVLVDSKPAKDLK
jgi:hypothetical protein